MIFGMIFLGLQPCDKAAMLVVNTKEIFLLNLHQNRVHFSAERNAFVLDHQHGLRDVKPAIPQWARANGLCDFPVVNNMNEWLSACLIPRRCCTYARTAFVGVDLRLDTDQPRSQSSSAIIECDVTRQADREQLGSLAYIARLGLGTRLVIDLSCTFLGCRATGETTRQQFQMGSDRRLAFMAKEACFHTTPGER